MKKYLLIALGLFLLYSCSKKKENGIPPQVPLIGRWIVETDRARGYTDDELTVKFRLALPGDYYQFNADTTGVCFNSLDTLHIREFRYRYPANRVYIDYPQLVSPDGSVRSNPANVQFVVTKLSSNRIKFSRETHAYTSQYVLKQVRTILLHKAFAN